MSMRIAFALIFLASFAFAIEGPFPKGFEWLDKSYAQKRASVAHLKKEDFLIHSLPDLSDALNFKQYSGYMPATEGTELFFWFVESQRTPEKDPLLLWQNGGPGSSSIAYGFWGEHGPFRLAENGSRVDLYEYSWNREASVIYLEAPSGVGFSWSENEMHYKTNDSQTAEDSFNFMLNLLEVFPEFQKNDLYLTGESYAGHYTPGLSALMLTRENKMNMKGFFIGNPGIENDWYYNTNEYAFLTMLWSNALLPQEAYLEAFEACGWSDFLTNCVKEYDKPNEACVNASQKAWQYIPKNWDPYNILTGTCQSSSSDPDDFVALYTPFLDSGRFTHNANITYNPCINSFAPLYMNRPEVVKSLHAEKHFSRKWPKTPSVWQYGDTSEHMTKLFPLFEKYAPSWNILVASGTADAAVPYVGTQRWISCLKRPVLQDWSEWIIDGDVAGTIKIYKGITLLTVKGCGHTIPTYCPKAGYLMLEKFLSL